MELIDKAPPTSRSPLTPPPLAAERQASGRGGNHQRLGRIRPRAGDQTRIHHASETLADGDIQDAQLLTDDRSFNLAPNAQQQSGGAGLHRHLSATDASGNKTTTSATVSVRTIREIVVL